MLWVLIRIAELILMRTHNGIMFLWRIAENYLKIIIRYSPNLIFFYLLFCRESFIITDICVILFLVTCNDIKWASSWDYGIFRSLYTHSSNAHSQPSSGARCLIFGQTLRLLPYFMCANSDGSGETARMRRLTWAFPCRLCGKYHNLMSWLKYPSFPATPWYKITKI